MKRLFAFLSGSVLISVSGADPERLVNRLGAAGVPVFDVRAADSVTLRARLRAADFLRLPRFVRGTGLRVRIVKKTGRLRFLLPLLARPFFVAGFAAALAVLYLLSGFVWAVKVVPNGSDDRLILRHLQNFGLAPGVMKKNIDEGQIKEQLILAVDGLAWVGVYITGSRATITYELLIKAPEIVPMDEPCGIYAKKTGILTKLNAFRGTKVKSVGETVFEGDLLISSEVKIGELGVRSVHAMGEAEARTEYELTAVSAPEITEKRPTGKTTDIYFIKIGNNRYKLSQNTGILYAFYDKIIDVYEAGETGLPVCVERERYIEYDPVPSAHDFAAEAERKKGELRAALSASLSNGRIVAEEWAVLESGAVRLLAECREEVGVAAPQ